MGASSEAAFGDELGSDSGFGPAGDGRGRVGGAASEEGGGGRSSSTKADGDGTGGAGAEGGTRISSSLESVLSAAGAGGSGASSLGTGTSSLPPCMVIFDINFSAAAFAAMVLLSIFGSVSVFLVGGRRFDAVARFAWTSGSGSPDGGGGAESTLEELDRPSSITLLPRGLAI